MVDFFQSINERAFQKWAKISSLSNSRQEYFFYLQCIGLFKEYLNSEIGPYGWKNAVFQFSNFIPLSHVGQLVFSGE